MDYGSPTTDITTSGGTGAGIWAGLGAINLIFIAVIYVYFAYTLMVIAKKTNQKENAWMSWIPILNVVLMLQIAGKPVWWIILMFIPIVNLVWIVLVIIVWMGIAKAVGQPEWWGILIIVPLANLIVPAYLAFSKSEGTPQPPQQSTV